mmetsp:Transcript_77378/g.199169  ORF Transcript_77378/g.199169 Transcript_77378/m.199169 type:complete len:270 (+) Transcript_77378:295-1104(+)
MAAFCSLEKTRSLTLSAKRSGSASRNRTKTSSLMVGWSPAICLKRASTEVPSFCMPFRRAAPTVSAFSWASKGLPFSASSGAAISVARCASASTSPSRSSASASSFLATSFCSCSPAACLDFDILASSAPSCFWCFSTCCFWVALPWTSFTSTASKDRNASSLVLVDFSRSCSFSQTSLAFSAEISSSSSAASALDMVAVSSAALSISASRSTASCMRVACLRTSVSLRNALSFCAPRLIRSVSLPNSTRAGLPTTSENFRASSVRAAM